MTSITEYLTHNHEHISHKAVEWMKEKYPFRTTAYEKCTRDISYILKAYYQDLINNSSSKTVYTANKFWKGNVRQVENHEVEIAVHNYIVDFIKSETTQDQHKSLEDLKNTFVSILETGPTINAENMEYLDVIHNFQHCQRNWDHSKVVDDKTIDFLLEAGYNVPTKQNLNSFTIVCLKTREKIKEWSAIARNSDDTLHWTGNDIKKEVEAGVLQNPQTDANLLFLFFINDHERYSQLRKEREKGDDPNSKSWFRDKMLEVGLSASAIGIAANQLGMRTGFCGCIWKDVIPEEWTKDWNVNPEDLAVMFGVGYPLHDDHRLHNEGKSRKDSYPKAPYKKIIA